MEYGLSGVSYLPTLGLRPAEMRAIEELPESTKDRLRSIILFAPWLGSKQLSNSEKRIKAAIDDRPFYLELDANYASDGVGRAAVKDFYEIRDEVGECGRYYALVESIESAVPVLRIEGGRAATIDSQLERINDLGRGFLVRIRQSAFPSGHIPNLDRLLGSGLSNYAVSVDCEWSQDVVSCEQWSSNVIGQFANSGATVPIAPSISSFPKIFSDIDGERVIPISSRVLFNNLSRRYGNQFPFIYGDWATTKPREYGMGRTPAARIDYAVSNSWVIFRKRDEWDYLEAAKALMNSAYWQGDLEVWGNLMINKTAHGDVTGITSPTKNVAARVNLHLQHQTWFDDPNAMMNTDDLWDDDL